MGEGVAQADRPPIEGQYQVVFVTCEQWQFLFYPHVAGSPGATIVRANMPVLFHCKVCGRNPWILHKHRGAVDDPGFPVWCYGGPRLHRLRGVEFPADGSGIHGGRISVPRAVLGILRRDCIWFRASMDGCDYLRGPKQFHRHRHAKSADGWKHAANHEWNLGLARRNGQNLTAPKRHTEPGAPTTVFGILKDIIYSKTYKHFALKLFCFGMIWLFVAGSFGLELRTQAGFSFTGTLLPLRTTWLFNHCLFSNDDLPRRRHVFRNGLYDGVCYCVLRCPAYSGNAKASSSMARESGALAGGCRIADGNRLQFPGTCLHFSFLSRTPRLSTLQKRCSLSVTSFLSSHLLRKHMSTSALMKNSASLYLLS